MRSRFYETTLGGSAFVIVAVESNFGLEMALRQDEVARIAGVRLLHPPKARSPGAHPAETHWGLFDEHRQPKSIVARIPLLESASPQG
jgi:hypothetical protein